MITHFVIKNPKKGKKTGICCVCSNQTNEGFNPFFSEKFTGYSFLTYGDCLCSHCYTFFKNQEFRKKSWIATKNEIKFLKRNEIKEVIIDPPEPPFYIYITQTGQRQGWLPAMRLINYNRDNFYIVTDFVGYFSAKRKEIQKIAELIKQLREHNVSKTSLKTGEYLMKQMKTAFEEKWDMLITEAKKYEKNPLWEVMIYVAD